MAAGVAIGSLLVLLSRKQNDDSQQPRIIESAPIDRRPLLSEMSMQVPIGRSVPVPNPRVTSEETPQAEQQAVTAQFDPIVPSMEDLVRIREESAAADLMRTPADVLEDLARGNARFWTGQSRRPELNAMERRAEIWQSYPKVAIIGCSDSRAPPEIIFDQGLGDLFVIRVAGNAYGTGVAGSVHYAVSHLHVKVVMVLGHEGCGVIRTAQQTLSAIDAENEELRTWLRTIRRGLGYDHGIIEQISDSRARDREAVIKNVRHQVRRVALKPAIAEKVATGALRVVGAFYGKRSGMVDFIRCDDFVGPTNEEEEDMQCEESEAGAAEPVASSSSLGRSGSHIRSAVAAPGEEAIIGDGPARVVVRGDVEQNGNGSKARKQQTRR